ncbi:septum formation family protein [Nocardia sp. NBC_01503]|uniref:septum formation family protein n=1 Tax=Nocardia sp. NBC_01503 TaxID=2975997 RepID=UPI002E7B62D4|nr:septum formation family protein [Nocardia sp. NBC_01503]WTL34656.1 septum formation family protein [Nocardia sp. NBC_01503]
MSSEQFPPPEQPEWPTAGPRKGGSRRASGRSGPFTALRSKLDTDGPLSAPTLRWGLLAVAVGAIVAALITMFLSGFDSGRVEAHNPGGAQPTGAVAGAAFGTAKQGDCLSWSKGNASDLVKVDCGSKHLFEVTADIDLSKYPGREFGPGSRFPDSLRFSELRDEHCVSAAQTYLGGKFDPRGKFVVGLINPGEAGWKAGERTLRCGLQVTGSAGTATHPITGSVRSTNQSKVFEVGTCVGIARNLPTDPVDCAQPHAFEIVSTVDLAARFPGGPPTKEDQDKVMEDQCAKDSTDYLGSPDALRNKTLTLFWDFLDTRSWLAGSQSLNCLIGKGADQEGFATITGSARGDLQIDGQAPVPPPNNGRYTPPPLPGAAPPVIPQPR